MNSPTFGGTHTAPRTLPESAADALRRRLETSRQGPAYRNYLAVLERVLRMREFEPDHSAEVAAPSDYWQEELANFEYMLDASPLITEKLRHHCHHITGIRVYDYRTNKDKARSQFAKKLAALRALDDHGLLVPESPLLGGYGFELDGELYNIDTLKFYEVLIAMDRGAVLGEFRDSPDRGLVWEIGAGWGGFAYQFKTLFPNVTYVITDFPELFLFSAVYLMTLFPNARVRFFGDAPIEDLLGSWREADFIFVPNTALESLRLEHPALTINMVSFQEMSHQQVESYVRLAHQLGSRYLYSLNRERSLYNTQLESVSEIIDRYYWPHEIPVLPIPYTKMLDAKKTGSAKSSGRKGSWTATASTRDPLDYRHVVGWRRLAR